MHVLMLAALVVIPRTVAEPVSPADAMAQIEAAQIPNRQGLDPFTLREIMEKHHVPGLAIA
ncbi:MAG TPA: hypothetical protein VLK65_29215, partial [Vicinamibacteria bacterium]|nr:hypothetical protein [Vicinamibacteria bacterium]